MSEKPFPVALIASDVPPRSPKTNYPEPFASRMDGREKRPLGNAFGLKNLSVNLTRLVPGGSSALRQTHTKQDEFVYVLQGTATLVTDSGRTQLAAGMCAGFRAGDPDAHHLRNESSEDVIYLEIGDRSPDDAAAYPGDDLVAEMLAVGSWRFTRKVNTPY